MYSIWLGSSDLNTTLRGRSLDLFAFVGPFSRAPQPLTVHQLQGTSEIAKKHPQSAQVED